MVCLGKSRHGPLRLAAKGCYSYPATQKGAREAWRSGLWGISLPGHPLSATLPEMTKWHCVSHWFVTFGAMSQLCTTGKDQLVLENVPSGRTDCGVCLF